MAGRHTIRHWSLAPAAGRWIHVQICITVVWRSHKNNLLSKHEENDKFDKNWSPLSLSSSEKAPSRSTRSKISAWKWSSWPPSSSWLLWLQLLQPELWSMSWVKRLCWKLFWTWLSRPKFSSAISLWRWLIRLDVFTKVDLFVYLGHVTSLTCKANLQSTKTSLTCKASSQSTNTSHPWIDFVYSNHKRRKCWFLTEILH